MTDDQTVKAQELQRFSQNASDLLLESGRLQAFLRGLNYHVNPHPPNEFRGPCPVCRASFCLIGTNGRIHTIYWKCFNRTCPSNTGKKKAHHNLLGLVRTLVEDENLGTAIKTIAKYLGCEGRSFDITNGKVGRQKGVAAAPQEKMADHSRNDAGRKPPEWQESTHYIDSGGLLDEADESWSDTPL